MDNQFKDCKTNAEVIARAHLLKSQGIIPIAIIMGQANERRKELLLGDFNTSNECIQIKKFVRPIPKWESKINLNDIAKLSNNPTISSTFKFLADGRVEF